MVIHLRPQPHGYDERYWLALKGQGALAEGEHLKLSLGESVVCGRSRHCDWSMKRTPGYLRQEDEERKRIRQTQAWRATSRRHCRLTYITPDMVEVENLSSNGTLVDGHRVDRIVLTDCRRQEHTIQLGLHGPTLVLAPGALPIEIP